MEIPNTFKGLKLQVLNERLMCVGTWVMSISDIANKHELLAEAENDKCVPGNIIRLRHATGNIPGRRYIKYYWDRTGQLQDRV